MCAGPTLVPFSGWPWPVMCLSVTNTLSVGSGKRRALEAADRRQPHLADEIRVLAIGLLDASPARIARHVDHRGQREVRAACAHLACRDGEDAFEQCGVPGAGERDRLREAGRAAARRNRAAPPRASASECRAACVSTAQCCAALTYRAVSRASRLTRSRRSTGRAGIRLRHAALVGRSRESGRGRWESSGDAFAGDRTRRRASGSWPSAPTASSAAPLSPPASCA